MSPSKSDFVENTMIEKRTYCIDHIRCTCSIGIVNPSTFSVNWCLGALLRAMVRMQNADAFRSLSAIYFIFIFDDLQSYQQVAALPESRSQTFWVDMMLPGRLIDLFPPFRRGISGSDLFSMPN
ncbi:unnamed protein product [Rhizoctonia solani]|uniref:Uncharacterized protein n=1 Tax=Rhizoctonia solani TaxID=456999 RepID=A0A8H2X689_9AGAM|nr:unnamed protein product [Rhizoctonia solani]